MGIRIEVDYSAVSEGLKDWLVTNMPNSGSNPRWIVIQDGYLNYATFFIEFQNEQDATFFSLAWR
jgi:hypothetical protein